MCFFLVGGNICQCFILPIRHLNNKMLFGPNRFSQNYPEYPLGETWVDMALLGILYI